VGKLLGIKVIDKEVALKRITRSLKNARKARINLRTK